MPASMGNVEFNFLAPLYLTMISKITIDQKERQVSLYLTFNYHTSLLTESYFSFTKNAPP